MEHEVAVPYPLDRVRRALADPVALHACVPGLQVDGEGPSGEEVSGRFRLRVGSSTITYRGVLRVKSRRGQFHLEAEGQEARGSGTAKAKLTVALRDSDDTTILRVSGTAEFSGRLAEADPSAAAATGKRLLDRFAILLADELNERLAKETPEGTEEASEGAAEEVPDEGRVSGEEAEQVESVEQVEQVEEAERQEQAAEGEAADQAAEAGDDEPAGEEPAGEEPAGEQEAGEQEAGEQEQGAQHAAEVGVPADQVPEDEAAGPVGQVVEDEAARPTDEAAANEVAEDEAAAEAAVEAEPRDDAARTAAEGPAVVADDAGRFEEVSGERSEEAPGEATEEESAPSAAARRTILARSAEEVDHAPPRGRYAPTPAPGGNRAAEALRRWVAPVTAAFVASAVVVGRLLRRRG